MLVYILLALVHFFISVTKAVGSPHNARYTGEVVMPLATLLLCVFCGAWSIAEEHNKNNVNYTFRATGIELTAMQFSLYVCAQHDSNLPSIN